MSALRRTISVGMEAGPAAPSRRPDSRVKAAPAPPAAPKVPAPMVPRLPAAAAARGMMGAGAEWTETMTQLRTREEIT